MLAHIILLTSRRGHAQCPHEFTTATTPPTGAPRRCRRTMDGGYPLRSTHCPCGDAATDVFRLGTAMSSQIRGWPNTREAAMRVETGGSAP